MTDVPDEWLPIGARTFRQRLFIAIWATASGFFVVYLAFQFSNMALIELRPALRLPLAGLLALVILVAIVAIQVARNPTPSVNFARSEIRAGRKTIPFATIDTAVQGWQGALRAPSVLLGIGQRKGAKVRFILRYRGRPVLDEASAERLIAVLEASVIAMPVDPYDPKGKFASSSFGFNLDRAGAIEFVRNPPLPSRQPKPTLRGGSTEG